MADAAATRNTGEPGLNGTYGRPFDSHYTVIRVVRKMRLYRTVLCGFLGLSKRYLMCKTTFSEFKTTNPSKRSLYD